MGPFIVYPEIGFKFSYKLNRWGWRRILAGFVTRPLRLACCERLCGLLLLRSSLRLIKTIRRFPSCTEGRKRGFGGVTKTTTNAKVPGRGTVTRYVAKPL